MKIIRLKLTKRGYFDLYVEATLSLIFKLTSTESKVVSLMLYYIDEEVSSGVPLEAAIRLVSMYEYRMKIREGIEVQGRGDNKKMIKLPEASLNNILSKLRGTALIDDKNRFNANYVIKHSDGGFQYKIEELHDARE
jgi:hypothetical protein